MTPACYRQGNSFEPHPSKVPSLPSLETLTQSNCPHLLEAKISVVVTAAASRLLSKLHEQCGPVVLYQGKGSFASKSLDCFPSREFLPSSNELMAANFGNAALYVRKDDIESLRRRQLVVDVGHGSGGLFSMERRLGVRFYTRLRKLPKI